MRGKSFKALAEELETAVALEYNGILFGNWTVDEENKNIWAVICQGCVDQHKDVLSSELTAGGNGVCGVWACDYEFEEFDESLYYIDFKLDKVHVLDTTQFMERYPELADLNFKLMDARMRMHEEAVLAGPDRENWL